MSLGNAFGQSASRNTNNKTRSEQDHKCRALKIIKKTTLTSFFDAKIGMISTNT